MADNPRDGDAMRLEKLRRVHAHRWGVDPTDEPELFFLLRLLDARDAALREAQRTSQELYAAVMEQKTEIERLRSVAEAARIWNSEHVKLVAGGGSTAGFVGAERELIRLVWALDAAPAGDAPDPAAAERAEIVAWLQAQADSGPVGAAAACRYVADLIERGEHKRPAAAPREGET